MSGFKLSEASRAKLVGVHPDLQRVVLRAIELSKVDFKVICGVRTPEEQAVLYAKGRTKPGPKVTWTMKSNHFVNPRTGKGHAVDLLVAPYDWAEGPQWKQMADAMFAAAKELDIKIRWGRDWDQDGIIGEKGETDGPHFELVR
jgi:peptidoglycan L-alanyl-D-glutamate endopeptidase CwlK